MSHNKLDLLLAQQKWRQRRSRLQESNAQLTIRHELQEVARELSCLYERIDHLQDEYNSLLRRDDKRMVIPITIPDVDEEPCPHCATSREDDISYTRDVDASMGEMSFPTSFVRNDPGETAKEHA
ncbi:hypothetical protein B0H13DRAFT_1852399 [Mycena leptocephala]|nr:hypothetical protein B0H13DRAFT_1875812 [Mycena leptocephala]KAJ7937763.1 hypothetical protein B0H13DRAFT_1852399 [Mycena leptocephala]